MIQPEGDGGVLVPGLIPRVMIRSPPRSSPKAPDTGLDALMLSQLLPHKRMVVSLNGVETSWKINAEEVKGALIQRGCSR